MTRFVAFFGFLSTALLLASFLAVNHAPAQNPGNSHHPDEVIIGFKTNASTGDKDQIRSELGGAKVKGFGRIKAELRKLEGMSVEEAISRYQNHPKVKYIEPNYIVQATEMPNDPRFSQLWGMNNTGQTGGTPGADIRATSAWDVFTGSDQVLIGVIDTGVDWSHEDLAANIFLNPGEIPGNGVDDDNNGYIDDVNGWDFVNNDNNPMDDNGHGTHVSGTLGGVGDNGIGVAGVSWTVKILPLKFLNAGGSGSTADAIEAVEYATMMGVDLTSNSWGGGGFSQALEDAIAEAGNQGQLFVAASGNAGTNNDLFPHYPSSYELDNIIAVASTDHDDLMAGNSGYGLTSVDLAAPGVNIHSSFPGNSYGTISGTSMATPHVSGALGLVFGRFPEIGHLDAKALILNSADPLPNLNGLMVTGARLNVFTAIADPDSIPPDAIVDLAIPTAGSNWLATTWTATGDDGSVGTASRYEIRYSELPITEGNFGSAALLSTPPDPGPAGTPEGTQVGGLDFDTRYYVAIKAFDEFGNASPISNVPDETTLGPPDAQVDPTSLTESLVIGETSTQLLTLSNLGEGTLDFVIPGPELITNTSQQAQYTELGKNEVDNRTGSPVIQGSGGPDGFGYRWADSDNPFGPAFNWFDISGPGTIAISSGDDSNVGPFNLGFTFSYYGAEYDQVRISSNGFLSFTSTSAAFTNQPLPTPSAPLNMVAPFWDDLVVSSGNVYYHNDGERFIVQWHSVDRFGGGGPYTFQAILHENGTIEFQYLSMAEPVNGATVGMQNATGTDALQMAFNTGYVHNNLAVRIQAVPQWLTVSPNEGTVSAPGNTPLSVGFDPSGLLGGIYQATIRILSNDPDEPEIAVPVALTVIGAPDIVVSPSAFDFGQAFLGATPTTVVTLENPGTDSLHVTSISSDNPVFTPDLVAIVIPPRESRPVVVTFAPTVVGMQNGLLSITSNDPDSPWIGVTLAGEGVTPPVATLGPTELQYDLLSNQSETQQVQLGNQGESNLTFSVDFAPPPVPPTPGAKIAVHAQSHALKSAWICVPTDEGGALPSTTPCTDYVTAASPGVSQDIYLVVTGVEEGEGVAGLSCGIDYDGVPGQGIDVRSWIFCGSGLQFPSDTWPAAASGNRMTWLLPEDCQNDGIGDQGVHAVFGAFYVYAYGPDTFSITENNTLAGGPELVYGNCQGAEAPIAVTSLGSVEFSVSGDEDGYNPCVGGVRVYRGPELAKGAEDSRIGEPVIHASGGPDTFGYTWIDSDAPNGPAFDWMEISGIGTPVSVQGVDGNSGPVPIGFSFPFYENTFSDVRVCTNGWLSFTSGSAQYTNQPLPATFAPENLLAVFWDDLVFNTQQAYSYNDGSRFIVQFQNVFQYIGGGGPYTFQVILYPNGTIVYQYLSMNGIVTSATVGIQNEARDDGLTVAFNAPYLHDNLAVRFSTQPQWVSIDPLEGTVPPSGSIPLDITSDATGLFGGLYEAEVLIRTNDPLNPALDLSVILNVTAAPDIFLPETALDYGDRFIGGTWDKALTVHNTGTATLIVTGITSSDPLYSVVPDSFSLAPGASRQIVVSFRPTDPRPYPAILTLNSNDPDTPAAQVTLSGTGTVPPDIDIDPGSLAEDLLSGQTSTQTLTIHNVGLSDLDLTIGAGFLGVSAAPPVADSSPPRITTLGDGMSEFGLGDGGSSRPTSPTGPVLDSREATSGEPVIAQPVLSGDDPLILIIQDTSAWGVTMSQFILGQFGLTATVINASQVGATDFSSFDIIITVGDESNAYYDVISSNREKFEAFVMDGGVVQYQLATQGANVEIAGGALVSFGNLEDENTVLLPDHPLVQGVPVTLLGNSANHATISNLPAGSMVVTETQISQIPTTVQYSMGSGHVIATGMTWEYLWNNGYTSGPMLYNAVAHSLTLIGPKWLSVDITEAIVPPGESIQVEVGFDADALLGGDYSAELIVLSNDPDESDVRVPVSLHVTGVPEIVLSTSSLDFGSPFLGDSRTQPLLVTNAGTDDLEISEMTLSDPEYTVNVTSFSLAPGEVQPVSVTFSPITPGQHPGTLAFLSNDPITPSAEVALGGEGLIPPVATLDPAELESNLLTNRSETLVASLGNDGESDLTFQIDFLPGTGPPDTSGPPVAGPKIAVHGQGHAAKAGWTCLPVDEGGLMPTTTPCSGYTTEATTNAGLDVYITVAGVDPDDGVAGVAFGVDYNGTPGQGVDVVDWTGCESGLEFPSDTWPDPGSGTIVTWFIPEDCQNTDLPPDGVHAIVGAMYVYAYSTDTFRITDHQALVNPLLAYAPCSSGERDIPLSNAGSIRFSPGASEPGFNPCVGEAAANQVSSRPEWLNVDPLAGTVPPGGTLPLQITTDATGLFGGIYEAEIFVNSNDPVNPSLSLPVTLNVTDAPDLDLSDSLLDFADVFIGYPETMPLVVTNTGAASLNVLSITSDLVDFSVTPTVFDLAPSAARLLTVRFNPQAEGVRNGTLTLYSNDVDSPHTVSLTGIGVDPPVASIEPDYVEGAALPGKSRTKTLSVMNDGGSDLLFSMDTVGPPPPQPTVGPKVAVHNKSHALKGAWICRSESEGGEAPTTLPCSEYITSGDLLNTYDIYLVMAGADSEGIGGLSCGIQYNDNPGQGIDIINWIFCGDGLQFPSDTPNWPATGSGNRMTWVTCQDDILPPDGGHAIAGAFYVYAYGSDSFTVTENLTLQSGPELAYVNCNGAELNIPSTAVGSVRYSSGGSQSGFNPCEGGVLVYGVDEQPKATEDHRIGFPVLDRKGGPDGAGYSWIDSREPGGPIFDWIDISGIGTPVAIQGDDVNSGPLPIGFAFPFYANDFTTFRVCTNGWISFSSSSIQHWNPPLPATNAPETLLAVFFDDLLFSSQQAYFHNDGNRLIVQYQDVYRLAGDGPFTFQVILSPDGSIVYQYLSMGGSVTSSTVGIQNGARDAGLTVAFNTPYLQDNLAIRFSNIPIWLDVTPATGTVPAGESIELSVLMDATDLVPADYTGTIGINTNDPARLRIDADVLFHVGSVNAADFDVDPNTLNLGSNGKWITASVELPSPYLPEQVLVETVLLNDLIAADPEQVSIGDFNENTVPDLSFKFDRDLVEGILQEGDSVAVTVTGEIEDQTYFVGMDYIRAIHPQLLSPNGGEVLLSGTFVEILWENPSGWQVESATLTYSEDAGTTWSLVAEGIAQNPYIWQVPPQPTEDALLRLHVFDGEGMLGYDSSDDVFQITNAVTGAQTPTPTVHALLQNAPNPFRSQSLIAFDLPVESDVKLQIFDVNGRVVRTLENRFLPAGRHQLVWNGRDDGGRGVGAGIYFYRIQAGSFVASRRMSLLR